MNKKDLLFTVGCILIVAAIMLVGVYGVVSKQDNDTVKVENTETVGVVEEKVEEPVEEITTNVLNPFYFGSSIQDIPDLELDVRFSVDDIDLENKNMKFAIYNPDLYDALLVEELKQGDKIVVAEEETLIESIEFVDRGELYFAEINGGIGESATGVSLVKIDENTYRSVIFNDHSTFMFVGDVEFPLADNFVIEDYFGGDYGNEGRKATLETLGQFIDELPENYRDFGEICTTLRVVDNKVVSIVRRWIP